MSMLPIKIATIITAIIQATSTAEVLLAAVLFLVDLSAVIGE